MGWYVHLPASSEMVLANPQVTSLKLLAVVSIAPLSGSTSCSSAPDAFVTFIDPITGLLNQNVLGEMDVIIDDKTVKKKIASKKLSPGDQNVNFAKDATKKPDPKCTGSNCPPPPPGSCIRVVGDKTDLKACNAGQNRRIQWREIFNFRTGIN